MAPSSQLDPGAHLWRSATALCDDATRLLVPRAHGEIAALRATLTEPLRVAVVGRVSTGKSTLVNALVGRRVAPTAAGECTLVPIWYRFGSPDRALLVLRDGSATPLPFDGQLPEELGVDPAKVDRIEVTLQSGPLRRLTLVDTPGLGSPGRSVDDVAREAGQAGAVLFLFRDVEKRDDIEFVRGYRESTGGLEPSTAGAVGLLSHADVFGGGPWAAEDPVDAARRLAERVAADHAALLSAVVPVSGLLAEAVRTGRVTEDDGRTLAGLADADPARLQVAAMLGTWDDGTDGRGEGVERVLNCAGPYVLARGREAARGGAGRLQGWMIERSGIGAVEQLVHGRLAGRARPLTADRLLRRLRALSRTSAVSAGAGERLRNRVEAVELSPEAHRVVELRALASLAGRRGPDARTLAAELARVVDEPPEQLRPLAQELRARAQRTISTARDPVVRDAARVLTRAYQLLGKVS
jgi:hypothetical protein